MIYPLTERETMEPTETVVWKSDTHRIVKRVYEDGSTRVRVQELWTGPSASVWNNYSEAIGKLPVRVQKALAKAQRDRTE